MANLNGNASNFIYTPTSFSLLAQFQRTHCKSTQGVVKIEMGDTNFRGFYSCGKETKQKGKNRERITTWFHEK